MCVFMCVFVCVYICACVYVRAKDGGNTHMQSNLLLFFPAWLELASISPACLFELKPPAVWRQFLNQLNNYVVTVNHTSALRNASDIFISNN